MENNANIAPVSNYGVDGYTLYLGVNVIKSIKIIVFICM